MAARKTRKTTKRSARSAKKRASKRRATKKTTKKKTAKKKTAKKKTAKKKTAKKKTAKKKTAKKKTAKKKTRTSGAGRRRKVSAAQMAKKQRQISVSEFFTKNRHLLGFDSPLKGVLTTVKEAVDNALDACEEAGIVPELSVELDQTSKKRFRVAIEDNGPGIVERQVGKIFGKLLYGSKFHKLSQTRGQQGIGISAAGMYGQLTTGEPMVITTRTGGRNPAYRYRLSIDTAKNKPKIHDKKRVSWDRKHGTRVEIEMEGRYQKGAKSVDMYLKQTAIANPHLTLRFVDPKGEETVYERSTRELPHQPVEIKPHPHGVELGRLIQMLNETKSKHLGAFLRDEFSRVGVKTAAEIIRAAGSHVTARSYPKHIANAQATALYDAIAATEISAPVSDCISPIGEELILEGLRKELEADWYYAVTRSPAVYRGNPFQVEVGVAYGKPGGVGLEVGAGGRIRKKKSDKPVTDDLVAAADEPARVLRFANRVPLLYQSSGCAITKAVVGTNWKAYGLTQPRGTVPIAPMAILVHIASVWVPFTSESKEAIASYPEILKELKLGLQDVGRKMATHIRKGARLKKEYEKRSHIETYIPHIGIALQEILDLSDRERDATVDTLETVLHRSRKF